MKYLKAEKECRTDLEMYVAVISAQKNTLENDTDKIRNEMKEGWYPLVLQFNLIITRLTITGFRYNTAMFWLQNAYFSIVLL